MSKFYGTIGFATITESAPGVWQDSVVTRNYYGDILRNTRQYQSGDSLNDNLNISNEFSIIADPFAYENFHSMKYVEYMGTKWKISNIDASQRPRLILTVGGVYNESQT